MLRTESLEIRPAVCSDFPRLEQLTKIVKAKAVTEGSLPPTELEYIGPENGTTYLYEQNKILVAAGRVKPSEKDYISLGGLVVHPDYQGNKIAARFRLATLTSAVERFPSYTHVCIGRYQISQDWARKKFGVNSLFIRLQNVSNQERMERIDWKGNPLIFMYLTIENYRRELENSLSKHSA